MQRRTRAVRLMIGAAMLATAAACGRTDEALDADLQRDLALVGASSIELAPAPAAASVVSAIERGEAATPARSTTRSRTAAPARTPKRPAPQPRRVAPRAEPVRQVADAPEREAPAAAPVPTPRPTAPAVSPPPPGGYRSVSDVIRNAPFPINP